MKPPNVPLYRYEFPDFGSLDVPIPEGFQDSSRHNDLSPSWYDETQRLELWESIPS